MVTHCLKNQRQALSAGKEVEKYLSHSQAEESRIEIVSRPKTQNVFNSYSLPEVPKIDIINRNLARL